MCLDGRANGFADGLDCRWWKMWNAGVWQRGRMDAPLLSQILQEPSDWSPVPGLASCNLLSMEKPEWAFPKWSEITWSICSSVPIPNLYNGLQSPESSDSLQPFCPKPLAHLLCSSSVHASLIVVPLNPLTNTYCSAFVTCISQYAWAPLQFMVIFNIYWLTRAI